MIEKDIAEKTKIFLKTSFIKNPHYSFNDWRIMYNHGVNVLYYSMNLAKKVNCDKQILIIASLLHDIGKTYKISDNVLRRNHDKFNYIVSEKFIKSLGLKEEQVKKIKMILAQRGNCIEKQIMNDADIIAFFADKKLQIAFEFWMKKNNFTEDFERKLNSFNRLNFGESKKIIKPDYDRVKKHWRSLLSR